MNPTDFLQHLKGNSEKLKAFIKDDLPDIVGTEAVNHFKENFQVEGFVDEIKQPWKEVKRRLNPRTRGARAIRKILTGDTGELGDATTYRKELGQVVVSNDKPYAKAHNEGTTTAGRNHSVTIPQRKFIGHSHALDEKIIKVIENGIENILK